jgi:hypothetical protein
MPFSDYFFIKNKKIICKALISWRTPQEVKNNSKKLAGGKIMSKEQNTKKETKKEPAKTMKEKKAEKRAKKEQKKGQMP